MPTNFIYVLLWKNANLSKTLIRPFYFGYEVDLKTVRIPNKFTSAKSDILDLTSRSISIYMYM